MLVLHIGLPKTGTTLLQQQVFAPAQGLDFVHRRRGPEAEALCRTLRRYVKAGPLRALILRRRVRRGLAAVAGPGGGVTLLVSDENVSVHASGFWRGHGPGPDLVARRIAEILPKGETRVVIGIRRQDQWLASRYAESSKWLDGLDQADFDRRMRQIAAAASLDGPLGWLDYDRMHRAFAAGLGAENVLLVPLEQIGAAPGATIGRLAQFVGVAPPDAARPLKASRQNRNRLSTGPDSWRMRRGGRMLRLDPEIREALRNRFAASNAALARIVPDAFDA